MPELKPCPFCGSKDVAIEALREWHEDGELEINNYITCGCGLIAGFAKKPKKETIIAWNKRVPEVLNGN